MNNYTSDFNPKQHKRFVLSKRCKNINFENNLEKKEKPSEEGGLQSTKTAITFAEVIKAQLHL